MKLWGSGWKIPWYVYSSQACLGPWLSTSSFRGRLLALVYSRQFVIYMCTLSSLCVAKESWSSGKLQAAQGHWPAQSLAANSIYLLRAWVPSFSLPGEALRQSFLQIPPWEICRNHPLYLCRRAQSICSPPGSESILVLPLSSAYNRHLFLSPAIGTSSLRGTKI